MKLHAPWTAAQVAKLNEWQASPHAHPFTCTNNRSDAAHKRYAEVHQLHDYGILLATPAGWRCPVCGYRQNWAHDFMFNGAPPEPLFFQGR